MTIEKETDRERDRDLKREIRRDKIDKELSYLARVGVGRTSGAELDAGGGLGLHVELQHAEVVTLEVRIMLLLFTM